MLLITDLVIRRIKINIEYQNPWFKVIKDGKFHYLEENSSDNGAVVIAVIDNELTFVNIDRTAHKINLIELPRGYGDKLESSQFCAARELYEETGHKFKPEQFLEIGVVRPNSAILSSIIPVYLIESLDNSKLKEHDAEVNSVLYINKSRIYDEISSGRISCGITLSALMIYFAHKK
jgi:ADP-ribose pyrophosphatase